MSPIHNRPKRLTYNHLTINEFVIMVAFKIDKLITAYNTYPLFPLVKIIERAQKVHYFYLIAWYTQFIL